jgi:hypothetical protein
MPEPIIKRRSERPETANWPTTTAQSSRLWPSWSTPSSAPSLIRVISNCGKKPCASGANCSAAPSTRRGDEHASVQTDSLGPLHSQQRHRTSGADEKGRLIERFTPYVAGGGRGLLRGDEAREWLERRRNEAIAELTLAVATIAMLATIVAAVRR